MINRESGDSYSRRKFRGDLLNRREKSENSSSSSTIGEKATPFQEYLKLRMKAMIDPIMFLQEIKQGLHRGGGNVVFSLLPH